MSTRRLISVIFLAAVAMATSTSLTWSQAAGPTVFVAPGEIEAQAGARIQVAVEIRDVANLGAFQFDLTHDPAIVQVDAVTLGGFAGSTGRSVNPLGPRIEAGRTVYGAFSFGDAAGPDGGGTLATVELVAQAGGETSLGLENVQVIDIGGARMPASAQGARIVVSGPPAAAGTTDTRSAGPTPGSTPTVENLLTIARARSAEAESAPPARDWVITLAALAGLVLLTVAAARLMTR